MELSFLSGPGEMARRIRDFDWPATRLGPPERWPATLRAMVRLMLSTRHPMYIFWGEDRIGLYNDAYSASLGPEKHPRILGMRGADAWPEIWPLVSPEIDRVMRGEGPAWHENRLVPIVRHGGLQDVYWTYSHDPIADESAPNGVGGVLVICTETTGQEASTRRLDAERARLSLMFEQAPGFMALLSGPEHRFELVNSAYRRLVGERGLLGRSLAEALPGAKAEGYVDLLDGVYRSGQPYSAVGVAYFSPQPEGPPDLRQVDFVLQPVRDDAGRVSGIFIEGSDVTDRARVHTALLGSEERLRQRQEQLRLATEAGDIGLWDVDLVSQTLYWPVRVKTMFGISADVSVTLKDFYDGVHPLDAAHTLAAFESALDPVARTVYDVEYRTVGKEDGRIRWVAAKGRGMFDAAGTCVRVIGTAIDITARKADEARLRELNERLEQRVAEALADKKVFADIVEGHDALVQVLGTDGRIVAINKAGADEFERLFGVRPKIGDELLRLMARHPEAHAAAASAWQRALAGEEYIHTLTLTDPLGVVRHYESKFNAVRDVGGRLLGAYQFVQDVTDRIEAAARLAQAEDALRQAQKMEAVGQLTGGLAHDFNNVLQVIQGSLALIQRASADPKVQKWTDGALQSVRRGAALTSQLLTFARKQPIEPRILSVASLLDRMEEMLQRTLGPLVRHRTVTESPEARVHADATQLELAVLNLAINARDAMPQGGLLTISTRVRRIEAGEALPPGACVEIAVQDTGDGMPSEVVGRAFEPFFTTKGVGKGSGLGLSQVYGMARQAGGDASIRSEPGVGTTVTLRLPRFEGPVDDAPASASTVAPAARRGASTILVVDDDPEVRAVIVASLGMLGHDVTDAEDGPAGLRALHDGEFDLMICDFAMPGMNGAEVASLARQRRPGLPILFASGYADVPAIRAAVGAGSTILRKPFELKELEAAVASVCESKRVADSA